MTDKPIVVEETFAAPIEVVWGAITDAEQMRQWYFPQIREFRPEVGFETEFDVSCEGETYPHLWKVTEVDPPRRVTYQWRYGGYPGDSTVVWELSSDSSGTRLVFTHFGHESLQGDPMFTRENCEAGWKYLINKSLKEYLA